MFIDTHAHLDFPKFKEDQAAVIRRAKEVKVNKLINIGCNLKSSQNSLNLAQKKANIFATVGIHPSDVEKDLKLIKGGLSDLLLKLEDLIKISEKVVGIGEIGLDYYWLESSIEIQKLALKKQLQLAKKHELPVVMHCRNSKDNKLNAYEDCFQILEEEKISKVVFHCFSGTLDFSYKVWNKHWLTSFTGVITYPNAGESREVVKFCPENLLMIETDCPFLAPQKYRGQRNEPAYVVEVAKKIAEIKGKSLEEIEKMSTENAQEFFLIF